MLVAGSNSVCDVCLESFGCDGKAPCSISCGHVFCVDCLDRVTKPSCPLCRNYFDSRATIRLHLDLDSVKPVSPPSNSTDLDHDEDARRLRDAINHVTKEGCSESQIRQLIQDGNKFFQRAPKGRYKELRVLHRMITYMCDVKSNLRQERCKVEQMKKESDLMQKEKVALEEEKARLLREIDERNKEKEAALKLEAELRDHCSRAHEAYTSMIDQYNYVAKEWAKLNEEVKALRMGPSSDAVIHSSPPTLELDRAQLNGAAVREGNSILCTPLPQFDNSVLQTEKSMFFKPLPGVGEEDEEDEDEEDDDEDDEEDEESSSEESDPEPSEKDVLDYLVKYTPAKADPSETTCPSPSHPFSCKCSGYSGDIVAEPRKLIEYPQPARPTYLDHVKATLAERPLQSALTGGGPRYDVRRARSYSNPSTSSSRTQSTSRSASRSPSPPIRSPAPNHFGAVYTSPLSQDSRGLQATPLSPPSRNTDSDLLRSRLHSILTDPSSSSPPKSGQMSSSVANRPPRVDRPSSPSRSPTPPQPSNLQRNLTRRGSVQHTSSTDHISQMLASHQSTNNGFVPPPSTSPSARTSSASEAARAIEQSKRDRRQATSVEPEDRQKRRSLDRERSQPEREPERARTSSSSSQAANVPPSLTTGLHRSATVVHPGAPLPGLGSRSSATTFHSGPPSANPAMTSPSAASYYSPPQAYQHRYHNPSPNKGIPPSSVLLSPHLS